jgi:ribonuclease HI
LSDSKNSLDFITEAKNWNNQDWAQVPHYRIQKLIIYTLNHMQLHAHNTYKFTKVKAHNKIHGNEEADALAKLGREASLFIINKNDLNNFIMNFL